MGRTSGCPCPWPHGRSQTDFGGRSTGRYSQVAPRRQKGAGDGKSSFNKWLRSDIKLSDSFTGSGIRLKVNRNPGEEVQWHQTNALRCEQDWDWWGAKFHLSRLAQLQPQDAQIQTRLRYAQQALGLVEAQTDSWPGRVKIIPPRPRQATVHHLDLTRGTSLHGFTNYFRSVKEDFWRGGPGSCNFEQLPCGLQTLAGVDFDIRCYVRLGRKPKGHQPLFPTNLTVRVEQTCKRLHFLHASDGTTDLWDEVGRYIVHFADGTESEIPICNRCDLLFFNQGPAYPLALHKSGDFRTRTAVPAWAGKNPDLQSERSVSRLFKFTWEIPKGPREVTSVELTSGQSPFAAPFVVAITVE